MININKKNVVLLSSKYSIYGKYVKNTFIYIIINH